MSHLGGSNREDDFFQWVQRLRRSKAEVTPKAFLEAARAGIREAWAAGVTTVADTGDSGAAAEARLLRHEGPAVVFDSYDEMARRIDDPERRRPWAYLLAACGDGSEGSARALARIVLARILLQRPDVLLPAMMRTKVAQGRSPRHRPPTMCSQPG